jgi:hypothetical protein
MGLSMRGKAMLFELIRQHNGRNNGHLQLSRIWLSSRGWKSADQAQKAKAELLERGLAIKTKLGGLSIGPDRFALTWLPISDFSDLEIRPGHYHPGKWHFMDKPPTAKKRDDQSAPRNSTVPPHGTGETSTSPPHGTVEPNIGPSSVPPHGNNECCQLPPLKKGRRVVGRKGKSGIQQPAAPAN